MERKIEEKKNSNLPLNPNYLRHLTIRMTRNLSLIQILLLVFAWQCCAVIFDDVTGTKNLLKGIVPTANEQFLRPAEALRRLGFSTLSNNGRTVNDIKANVDLNENGGSVFDVTKHGAKADGKTDDAQVRNINTPNFKPFNLS